MKAMSQILQRGARVVTVPRGGGYSAQVLPVDRQPGEPIVLLECRHTHRTERAALQCGQAGLAQQARRHGVVVPQ